MVVNDPQPFLNIVSCVVAILHNALLESRAIHSWVRERVLPDTKTTATVRPQRFISDVQAPSSTPIAVEHSNENRQETTPSKSCYSPHSVKGSCTWLINRRPPAFQAKRNARKALASLLLFAHREWRPTKNRIVPELREKRKPTQSPMTPTAFSCFRSTRQRRNDHFWTTSKITSGIPGHSRHSKPFLKARRCRLNGEKNT